MGHDVRIKVVFDYECPLLEPRILTNPHMIQTGHIWFFQLAVCFWVLGLPLFGAYSRDRAIDSAEKVILTHEMRYKMFQGHGHKRCRIS